MLVPGLYPVTNKIMARLTKVDGERALYKDPSSGTYFVRVYHNGTDTFRSLETTRIKEAIERLDARRAAKAAAKLGLTLEPDSAARAVTVADAIQRYVVDGYPDKRGRPRMRTEIEAANCVKLSKFFADGELVDNLTPNVLDKYHAWRIRTVKMGQGHRATDLELNTLNNALRWAVRKELVRINPIQSRSRYHSSREARHCRELAPANAEELHEIARLLFQSKRSETLGWQALFEANLGLRTSETLSMRMDARPDEAGGLTADGKSLCVRRSKDPRRDNPYAFVHDGLEELLAAHKRWHRQRYPKSPWYFPGRDRSKLQPVYKNALTQAMERLRKQGKLKRKITSHGMRAFYVLVRRSHGISDPQIAWEVNHTGGVGTLESVYGGVPPHWLQGKGPKLNWLPKGKPAWSAIRWKTNAKAKARSQHNSGR